MKPLRQATQSSRRPTSLQSFSSSSSSGSPQPPDADRQQRHLVLYEEAWPKRPRAFHPSTPDHDRPFDAFASALYSAICALPSYTVSTGQAEPDFVSDSDDSDDEKAILTALPAVERSVVAKMREKDRKRRLVRLRRELADRANGVAALFSEDEDEGDGEGAGSRSRRKRLRLLSPAEDWELDEVLLKVRLLDPGQPASSGPLLTLGFDAVQGGEPCHLLAGVVSGVTIARTDGSAAHPYVPESHVISRPRAAANRLPKKARQPDSSSQSQPYACLPFPNLRLTRSLNAARSSSLMLIKASSSAQPCERSRETTSASTAGRRHCKALGASYTTFLPPIASDADLKKC